MKKEGPVIPRVGYETGELVADVFTVLEGAKTAWQIARTLSFQGTLPGAVLTLTGFAVGRYFEHKAQQLA